MTVYDEYMVYLYLLFLTRNIGRNRIVSLSSHVEELRQHFSPCPGWMWSACPECRWYTTWTVMVHNSTTVSRRSNGTKWWKTLMSDYPLDATSTQPGPNEGICSPLWRRMRRKARKISSSGTTWNLRGAIPQRKWLLSRLKTQAFSGLQHCTSHSDWVWEVGMGLALWSVLIIWIMFSGKRAEHEADFKFGPDTMYSCFLMDLFVLSGSPVEHLWGMQ